MRSQQRDRDVAIAPTDHLHSPTWRSARLIGTVRLVFAIFALLSVWLDATELGDQARALRSTLAAYAVYSLVALWVLLRVRAPLPYPIVQHVVDVLVVAAFLHGSERPSSPLLPVLSFLLIVTSLGLQSRGPLRTTGGGLLLVGATTLRVVFRRPERFELNEIIWAVSVIVLAALFVRFGAYEERARRRDLQRIVRRPELLSADLTEFSSQLSQWTASVMGGPRTLIAWTQRGEPGVWLAAREGSEAWVTREVSAVLEPLVVPVLEGTHFLCRRARKAAEPVLHTSESGFARWRGTPLNPVLAQRFAVNAVLSVRFETALASGRLFVLDKMKMTSDDLVLGEIVAQQVAQCFGEFYMMRRLADAVREERMRVSRELHDGALNTLAGVRIELENLLHLPEFKSCNSQGHLREVQTSLEVEHRALRSMVEQLRTNGGKRGRSVALTLRLRQLVERVERQRGIKVEWKATDVDALTRSQADDLYLLLQEAVMNAVRHSGASTVWFEAERRDGQVTAVVGDNGRGFPFKGRYDLERLISSRLGPTTLKERVAELGGTLIVDSSAQGAQVRISLKTSASGA